MARKPSALARELLRNFPRGRRGRGRGRRRKLAEAEPAAAGAHNGPPASGSQLDDAPPEAVLDEALTGKADDRAGDGGAPLDEADRGRLEETIAGTLGRDPDAKPAAAAEGEAAEGQAGMEPGR
jgi:hypothetical protein